MPAGPSVSGDILDACASLSSTAEGHGSGPGSGNSDETPPCFSVLLALKQINKWEMAVCFRPNRALLILPVFYSFGS